MVLIGCQYIGVMHWFKRGVYEPSVRLLLVAGRVVSWACPIVGPRVASWDKGNDVTTIQAAEELIRQRGIGIPEVSLFLHLDSASIAKLDRYSREAILVYAERMSERQETKTVMDPVLIKYGDVLLEELQDDNTRMPLITAWLCYLNAHYRSGTARDRMRQIHGRLSAIYAGKEGDLSLFFAAYYLSVGEVDAAKEIFKSIRPGYCFTPDYSAISSRLGKPRRYRSDRIVSDIIRDLCK